MLHGRCQYRAGVIIAHLQERSTGKGVGATVTALTIAGIVLSAGTAALVVLKMRSIGMAGMLTGGSFRGGQRSLRQPMQHRRTGKREGQQQGKYETRRRHWGQSSTLARQRQTACSLQ